MTDWQTIEAQEPDKGLQESLRDLASVIPGVRDVKFPERPLQAGLLFAPGEVHLDGENLVWSLQGARYKPTRSGMLDDFIRLCDADDFPEAVLSFARRWGLLGICDHGLPCSHNQGLSGPPCLPMLVTPLPREGDFRFWEPINVWWAWSRRMKALLSIAGTLNRGKRASFEDWNTVKDTRDTGLGETEAEPYVRDLPKARRELAWEVDGWISIGQVRPRISWHRTPQAWRFSLDAVATGPNLFGLLALYVATEVTGTGKGIAICSSCTNAYRPERWLNPKNRNYCPKCRGDSGKQAARRDASREYRRRKREKGR
jgi:hypothetical protein